MKPKQVIEFLKNLHPLESYFTNKLRSLHPNQQIKCVKIKYVNILREYWNQNFYHFVGLYGLNFESRKPKPELEVVSSLAKNNQMKFQLMKYLAKQQNQELRVPQTLWYDRQKKTIFYRAVPGFSLQDLIGRKQSCANWFTQLLTVNKKAALILAALHSLTLPSGFKLTHLTWRPKFIINASETKRSLYPQLTKQVQSRIDLLLKTAKLVKHPKSIVCHGDFQPTNLIINQSKIYLIDFGNFIKAPYTLDLAVYLTQLNNWLTKTTRLRKQSLFKQLNNKFLRTYQSATGWPVNNFKQSLIVFSLLAYLRDCVLLLTIPHKDTSLKRCLTKFDETYATLFN